MGRPHYGVNPGWGVTYTEPHTKLEFDSAIGVTFNAKNPATDYKDGDDFIWDWAVGKKLQDMSANGTKQTCSMRRRMSASGGKTDVDQPLFAKLDF